MSAPMIRAVPLSQLELSAANVRKTPASQADNDELKASIAAHGLLENLVARPLGLVDGVDRYAVLAGSRRLAALQSLAHDVTIDEDFPVSCLMVNNAAEEQELSLAENMVRVAMHPADQVETFAALVDQGATVAQIAARFGISERTVEQRLQLGSAAPELLDAYRNDHIDMKTLMAFAVTTDRDRQRAVWKQVKEQGFHPGAWQVKRMLTEDRVQGNAEIARFVGIEDYEAAGGTLTRDLFAEENDRGVWFDDPKLLSKLATAKLKAAACDLQSDWKWIEPRLDVDDWNAIARYGRVSPKPGEPTDEERAEIERLTARRDELVNLDDDDWTDELIDEGEAVEKRLDEIEAIVETRAAYSPEQRAIAGCIVTIDHDGNLRAVKGLIRPEDMPAAKAGTEARSDTDDPDHGGHDIQPPIITSPRDPRAEARKKAGVGIGLADDLRAIRTGLVKSDLATDFDAAFDLLLFQLARSIFHSGYHANALDITIRETADHPMVRGNDKDFAEINVGEQSLIANRAGLALDWMHEENDGEAFKKLCALSDTDKCHLFASCVARTVNGQLAFEHGARPELEHTVAQLDNDFAAHFRPPSELYWQRIRKSHILDIARETLGEAWAQAHAKHKKVELADAMEEAFAAGDTVPTGVSPEAHTAALAWTPPGFRAFDEAALDTEPPTATAGDITPEDTASASSTPTSKADRANTPPTPPTAEDDREDPGTNSADEPAAGSDHDRAVIVPGDDATRITIAEGGRDITVEREQPLSPPRSHSEASDSEPTDPLELPAFLRRTPRTP